MPPDIPALDLAAYCAAFAALDRAVASQICRALDIPHRRSAASQNTALFTDEYMAVTSFVDLEAGVAPVSVGKIWQNGSITRDSANGPVWIEEIDPLAARYFIVGALRCAGKPAPSESDPAIIYGIEVLYAMCRDDADTCLSGKIAAILSRRWGEIGGARRMEEAENERAQIHRTRIEVLLFEYRGLASACPPSAEIAAKVEAILSSIPDHRNNIKEQISAEEAYRQAIALLEMYADGSCDAKRGRKR